MQANASRAPVSPDTPERAQVMIGAAGNVAYERRQPQPPKRLMNCFRDRSSSSSTANAHYMRSHSSTSAALLQANAGSSQALDAMSVASGRPEAVVLLRELRTKPNKLALLKSSSSKDLTRLLLDENLGTALLVSNNSLDMLANSSNAANAARRGECCGACSKRWQGLKQRMHTMEQDMQAQASYTQELELKLSELSRQLQELLQEKRTAAAAAAAVANHKRPAGSTPVRPSRLVAWMNLSNWFKSRPSVETLREQRIFFDEPCFDTELELVLKHDQQRNVPRIVVDCCDLIEQKYRRSTQQIEGIYRQCGDYNKIQTLRFDIDANDYDALRQPSVDIHTLTGVLKLFLREIKSPLISVNEAKTFIGAAQQWLLTELNQKLETLKRLIRSLPETNRDTMDYLFAHFNRLTKVPLQQVSAETLAISVTPSIFHTVPQGVYAHDLQQLLREGETLADCVKLMIEYHNRIFECSADRRHNRLSMRNLKKTLSQPDLLFHNIF
ncbi:RhoGAP16F [Drosophila busckii]|uniref:RhoGAP16F n=1 Tax=Drosophila busckii TaxID=30019 RepID=A0A0M4F7Y0_DROBS|nr:uncharacterized protein LOC108605556 [Drosophila busckii]ALC48387.1 RhoGAP16F [Drosophila busckii]